MRARRARSPLQTFGGDASTGIQNAAANTEAAVVNGFNQSAAFQKQLAEAMASRSQAAQVPSGRNLERAASIVILSLGVMTFVLVLARRSN